MKKITSILLMIVFIMITTKVQAASDSFNTTLSLNNSQAKRGDTITVTLGLKDIAIESGEKGIGAYTTKIQFDSSVLEYVSTKDTDKWEAPFYQDGFLTSNTKDAEVVTTTQSIGTITFKVKENAKVGETSIALTNFSGSSAETDILASSNGTAKLTIIDNKGNGQTGELEDNKTLEDKKTQENTNTVTGLNVLPKTGKQENTPLTVLVTLMVLSIIALIGFICFWKKREK